MDGQLFTAIRHDTLDTLLELPGSAQSVYLALAKRAKFETGVCWPGYERIASDAHVSLGSVKTGLKRLKKAGLLSWINRPRPKTNFYTVLGLALVQDGSKRSPINGSTVDPPDGSISDPQTTVSTNHKKGNESFSSAWAAEGSVYAQAGKLIADQMCTLDPPDSLVDSVLKLVGGTRLFGDLDISKFARNEVLASKLAEFYSSAMSPNRLKGDRQVRHPAGFYKACFRTWLEDVWDYYSVEWSRLGEGGHLGLPASMIESQRELVGA
jgi:hypothetical protein